MFQKAGGAALLALLLGATPVAARDAVVLLPIAHVIDAPAAQQKLQNSVQLYFGARPARAVIRDFGNYRARRKTNGFAKSEEASCDQAFLSALREMQGRAASLGANAVVNIESDYNHHQVSSRTDYECHKGFLMAGVALRGDIVRLAGK